MEWAIKAQNKIGTKLAFCIDLSIVFNIIKTKEKLYERN